MNSNAPEPEVPAIFADDKGNTHLLIRRTRVYKNKKKQSQGDQIIVFEGKITAVSYLASTRTTRVEHQTKSNTGSQYWTTPKILSIKNMSLTDHNELCEKLHDYSYRNAFVEKL